MTDAINRIFSIILVFLSCVLGPYVFSTIAADNVTSREVLNETSVFIDKVTDKGTLTREDLDDFYLALNSHGGVFTATISHYQLIEEPVPGESSKLLYVANSSVEALESGMLDEVILNTKDCIQVHVTAVTHTTGDRLIYRVLGIDRGVLDFHLAGTVT